MPKPNRALLSMLARSILAGQPSVDQIISRTSQMLGRSWRWVKPLAQRYAQSFSGKTRPREREVIRFLLADEGFKRACSKYFDELAVARWLIEPQRMQPVAVATEWDLPIFESGCALADWLGLSTSELEWFADLKGLERRKQDPRFRHYHYRILLKLSGRVRLIEAPKSRLKEIQRKVLARLLEKIPPHPAAHGFLKGRSIKTFIASHIGQRVILRMDVQDFFPCLIGSRIQAIFRTAGYPESVADLLGGICTNAAPRDVWKAPASPFDVNPVHLREAQTIYSRIHLPQGAPTSPALANLTAFRLDCRLTGLAKSAGAVYTRYADDLAFSGDEEFRRAAKRFSAHAAAIALEEGFHVNHRKTRILRQGVRQQLAGVVVNQKTGVRRRDRERLEAILTNCIRFGPESQNRAGVPDFRAHLEGRIGFIAMI